MPPHYWKIGKNSTLYVEGNYNCEASNFEKIFLFSFFFFYFIFFFFHGGDGLQPPSNDAPVLVDLTGNVNTIEKLVLGGTGTGDLPIVSPTR